jgi:DnaJ-class molecular chaperone
MIDPYVTLGVSKAAKLEDIKSAYKKLARKYHPDLNPGNQDAERKFKEIAHAFDLIGTKDARKKFDQGETDEHKQHSYDEYMNQKGTRKRPFYYQSQGDHGRYSSNFNDEYEDLFSNIFGGRRESERPEFSGKDTQYQLEIDFLEAVRGAEKIITLPNGKKLQVKIPPGIKEGQKLKFSAHDEPGVGRGQPGDAYVEIKIRSSSEFRREGQDIYSEVSVSFFEAVNGAEVEVQTIDGPVSLKIPPGATSGLKLRIKGKGAGRESDRGSQIVIVKVVTPRNPSPQMKEAFRNLEKQFAYNPRANS